MRKHFYKKGSTQLVSLEEVILVAVVTKVAAATVVSEIEIQGELLLLLISQWKKSSPFLAKNTSIAVFAKFDYTSCGLSALLPNMFKDSFL